MGKNRCTLHTCRFSYEHYYAAGLCGPVGNGAGMQPMPTIKEEKTVEITNAEAFAAEEPLAEWEKELLKPDPNAVVHMYLGAEPTVCDTKIDDGGIHLITGNLAAVSCSDCRIKTLVYYNEQLQGMVNKEKEKVRVANQATSMVRTELRTAHRVNSRQRDEIRRLREDIERLHRDDPYRLHRVDGYGNRY